VIVRYFPGRVVIEMGEARRERAAEVWLGRREEAERR
jgi:hypothetical protein